MKKITFTFIACFFLLFNLIGQEQVLLQEDFNNGFPPGWQSNSVAGNNQWVIPPLGGPSIDGTDMMFIQAIPNQQSITELILPQLPPADPQIDVVGLFFTFNQLSQQNSNLKVVVFDDQNPNIPIELVVLNQTICDPNQPWSCAPDFPDIWIEIPNYDPNDKLAFVFEDFDPSGTDFFAFDNIFIWGFNNCPLGLIEDVNFPPTCHNGNDAQLEVTAILGEPPYQYSLDNGPPQANGKFTTTPGQHTITVTDNVGCVKVYTFTVPNAPAMSLQTTTFAPTCFNGNNAMINATASGGTPQYFYSLDNGPAMAVGDFMTTPGAHTITVTDSKGCVQVFNVNVPNTPDMTVDLVHTATLLCFGDSDGTATANVTAGGTAPYQYSLNGGAFQAGGTFNNLPAGNHSITAKDANNCTRIENFTINQPPQLTVTAIKNDLSCFGSGDGIITVTAMGGTPDYKYGINGSGSATGAGSVFSSLSAGEYFPAVEDANGCEEETGIFLNQPLQLASDTISVTSSTGSDGAIDVETTGGNPNYVYLWSNGEITQDIEDLAPGEYWLFTTDQNNCPADTLFVTVPMFTSVENVLANEIKILGNPAKGHITVQLSDYFILNEKMQIQLFDVKGKLILENNMSANNSMLDIPVRSINVGMYILQIINEQGENFIGKIYLKN